MNNNTKSFLSFLALILILVSCNKDEVDQSINTRENYLVEKITRFESSTNFTTTAFIYDGNNKLIKRIATGKFVENNQVRNKEQVHEFEYKNGLVSKIHVMDLMPLVFSYDIHFFYNSQEQLIRQEIWNNSIMGYHMNFYYSNNKMVSVYYDNTEPFQTNTIYYDDKGNAVKHTYIFPKTDMGEQIIPGEFKEIDYLFEYDNKLKPNIGLDYLFVYTPFYDLGTETEYVRELSNNNLSKYNNSGTNWTYEYNEVGLPIKLEKKLAGSQALSPMIWEVSYKKIK